MARKYNTSLYKQKSLWGIVFVFAMLVGTLVVAQLATQTTVQPAAASYRGR